MSFESTDPARALVERMGILWESDGLPRIAGRIVGLLLLQDEPCSLSELADALGVSKASVSVDARRLEQHGFVIRVSRPGDRRDYYAIADDMLVRALAMKLETTRRLHGALVSARELSSTSPRVQQRLVTFERVHGRAVQVLETLVDDLRHAGSSTSVIPTDRRST